MRKFKAIYKLDSDGNWIVRIPELPGCHTSGRSLTEARRNIREALECCVDVLSEAEVASAVIVDDVQLPSKAKRAVRRALAERARIQNETEQLQETLKKTVELLTEELGIGLRDIGQLLQMSHQRVHQITDSRINGRKA
jgi:predicted RNase H-like HicB family nuclease